MGRAQVSVAKLTNCCSPKFTGQLSTSWWISPKDADYSSQRVRVVTATASGYDSNSQLSEKNLHEIHLHLYFAIYAFGQNARSGA